MQIFGTTENNNETGLGLPDGCDVDRRWIVCGAQSDTTVGRGFGVGLCSTEGL